MTRGTRVRILVDAGLCRPDNDSCFVGQCRPGTIGIYWRRHPRLPQWHEVMVGELMAPLHATHFEEVKP